MVSKYIYEKNNMRGIPYSSSYSTRCISFRLLTLRNNDKTSNKEFKFSWYFSVEFVSWRINTWNMERAFSQHSQSRNKKSAAREANSDALRTLLHNDENVPTSSFCAFLHLGRSSSYFFHLPGQQPHLRNEWRRRHRKLVQYTIYFFKFNIRTNFVPFFFTHF